MNNETNYNEIDNNWKTESSEESDIYTQWRSEIIDKLTSQFGVSQSAGDWILAASDMAHLAIRFIMDPEVDAELKLRFIGAIAYVVSPWNFLPRRMLGPIGWLDDIAALGIGLDAILNGPQPWIVRRHWAGGEETLRKLQEVMTVAGSILPTLRSAVWLLSGTRGRFPGK